MGALSDTSPPSRRFMLTTSCSLTPSRFAISLTWSGCRSPSSSAEILLFALRRLKNSFFWFAVLPNLTSDHERRMYSWIAAQGHDLQGTEGEARRGGANEHRAVRGPDGSLRSIPHAPTSLFVPEIDRLFVAARANPGEPAA